jgi:hypothetical protein
VTNVLSPSKQLVTASTFYSFGSRSFFRKKMKAAQLLSWFSPLPSPIKAGGDMKQKEFYFKTFLDSTLNNLRLEQSQCLTNFLLTSYELLMNFL